MGMKLHELAKRMGLISYVIVANTLIDLYSKCSCVDKALEVFHHIPDKNVISWTSIILGLRINNQSFEALTFFRQMKLNLNPNFVTLVSVLCACARIGSLMCGKEIHAHALRIDLGFDGFLLNAVPDMYVGVEEWNLRGTYSTRTKKTQILGIFFLRAIPSGDKEHLLWSYLLE